MNNKGEIILYQTPNGETALEVRLEEESVWLSQKQMAELFDKTTANVNIHIKNIYNEQELDKESTIKKSLIVQNEGERSITREVDVYNLDVIISVGYRVKSQRGTQFRIWANSILKQYLIDGYSINEKRLKEQQKKLSELAKTVMLFQSIYQEKDLQLNEAKGLLELITNYTRSFALLNQFDSNSFSSNDFNQNITYEITYQEAYSAIQTLKNNLILKKEASKLFGNEKDNSFKGILGSIVQTFGGQYLYQSIEAQASHLLYFVIKNHPFSDGNKRIGSFLFIWFLQRNNHQLDKKGKVKINENTLVALALLVAQSQPSDKDLMIKLIINLINQ